MLKTGVIQNKKIIKIRQTQTTTELSKLFFKWKIIKSISFKQSYIEVEPYRLKLHSSKFQLNFKPSLKQILSYKLLKNTSFKHNNKIMIIQSTDGITTNFDLIKNKRGGVLLYTITL